jgi:hypothetical protein
LTIACPDTYDECAGSRLTGCILVSSRRAGRNGGIILRFAMDDRHLDQAANYSSYAVAVLVLADAVTNLIRPIYHEVAIALASLIIFILIQFFLERLTRLRNPPLMRIFISILVFTGVCLGRFFFWYQNFPGFDKFMHFLYGLAFCICGFVLFYLLNPGQKRKLTVRPAAVALFAIGITLLCSFGWELFEFIFDRLFDTNMQNWRKSLTKGVTDTMLDQFSDLAGGILAGVLGSRGLRRDPQAFYQRWIAGFLTHRPEPGTGGQDAQQGP